ncbi:MAG: Cu-processing system ATP-binding protein, partial [Marinoscillum sp.]
MIKVKDIHKQFGQVKVLDGVSFDINQQGVVAVLGPNGSGKTTVLKTILGMVLPQSGEIFYKGQPIIGKWDYRKEIGYLPQIAQFPDNLIVSELIDMIKNIRNMPSKEEEIIELFGVEPF